MLKLGLLAIAASFLSYRLFVLTLPFFQQNLANKPILNVLCGLASDATVLTVILVLGICASGLRSKFMKRLFATLGGVAAGVVCYALMVHLRYVEHFGMNLRPFHFAALDTGEVWSVGPAMVAQSWRANGFFLTTLLFMAIGFVFMRRKFKGVSSLMHTKPLYAVSGLLLLGVLLNATVIQLRVRQGLHSELRYNPFVALFYNLRDDRFVKAMPVPKSEELPKARDILAGERHFPQESLGERFPFWQTHIASQPNGFGPESVRGRLGEFIRQGAAEHGPWNVVIVIQESLRAKELAAFGNDTKLYRHLTPNLSRFASESIVATQVIASGFQTHYGQTAIHCSLYGQEGFTLMVGAPMSNAVCLGDVFSTKGYQTKFFYGADNHFDNQDIFYSLHGIKKVYGEEHIDPKARKGGWGYSDHALFEFTSATLATSEQPFFATILTLTNHAPYKVPDDAPVDVIDKSLDVREQILQYVDWSFGHFLDQMKQSFPHTILMVIADHGQFRGEPLSDGLPDWELVKATARIPWYLYVPGMPSELQGVEIDQLASIVDLPPTLLSLLDWHATPQQFHGQDLFSRQGPVYTDWAGDLLEITNDESGYRIDKLALETQRLLGAMGRYNLIAPPKEAWLPTSAER